MPFPNTDWPASYDSIQDRTDGFDTVWASDFDYSDEQIRKIQAWIGTTGKLLGEDVAGAGPSGVVSPEADGGVAFKIAARNDFTSGKLLSIGDDFDVAYVEKFNIEHDGTVGLTPQDPLPAAGTQGRLAYKSGTGEGLYTDTGSVWTQAGGGSDVVTSYADISTNAQSAMGGAAAEDRVGEVTFDGSAHNVITFEALVTPTFATTGTVNVRLYDVGPVAGPPVVGRLVTTLTTTTAGGPQRLTQTLTVVGATPTTNEILDSDRMYQATVEVDATTGDDCYVGSISLVGVGGGTASTNTDTTAIHENVPAEISAITEKVSPVSADLLLIEDSADSNNKKRVQVGNLPSTDADAIHDNVAGEIAAVTAKATPTTSDYLLIEDAAAGNAKKSITIGDLPGGGGGADGRGFAIVIGNSLEGDTSDICDYLDVGDGAQLKAGIEAAAGAPVFIRPGTYDFNNGAATSNEITVPAGTRVEGASIESVVIRALSEATEGQMFVLNAGCVLEKFTISVPTPTALVDSLDSQGLIYPQSGVGIIGMERVRVVYEDDGWSTMAGAFNAMNYLIYSEANGDKFYVKDCEFIDVPNYETTPGAYQDYIQLFYQSSVVDVVEFKDNFVTGSNLTLELFGDRVIVTGNVILNAGYDYIVRLLGNGFAPGEGRATVTDNVFQVAGNASYTQYGILDLADNGEIICSNEITLVGSTGASSEAVSLTSPTTLANNFFNFGSQWPTDLDVGFSASGTVVGNYFSSGVVSGSPENMVFEGNYPSTVGGAVGTGVESTLWHNPRAVDNQIEFTVDSQGTSDPTDTENAGFYRGIWDVTGNAAGSYSKNTVDVFDTTFNSGTAVRYIESPDSRQSYTFLQAPASGNEFFLYFGGYTFKLSEGFPFPTIYDQVLISRLGFQQRLTPIASDAQVGMFLSAQLTVPSRPDVNNYLLILLSDTTGGNMVATYKKVDGGVPSIIGSSANVGAEGQALEHAAIVYKASTGDFHGFVGTAGGNWIYLGATTMTAVSLQVAGVYMRNASVGAPGVPVVKADFLRNFKTDPASVPANFLF